jgi:hypothetical protein
MQGRSWMATSPILASLILIVGFTGRTLPAQAQTQVDDPKPRAKAESKPGERTTTTPTYVVEVDLKIAGLGRKGCDVEIKPGNSGCKFKAVTQHIEADGKATIKFKDIETQSADRDCTFAITVHEPGQAEKTVKRGLRLKSPGNPGQSLNCFLSSPSKIARAEKENATKR